MYELQPEKKSGTYIYVLAIIGGIALVLFACAFFVFTFPSPSPSTSNSSSARNEVVYKIRFATGLSNPMMDPCAEFGVTYAMPSGTAQKDMEACTGLTEVARFRGDWGDHLYLSIQNTWPKNNFAQFSCIIEVDGKNVAQVESIGWPNIASCSTLLK